MFVSLFRFATTVMAKTKTAQLRRDPKPAEAPAAAEPAAAGHFVVFRETVESIVVAFVLAFLFRTFEAEAFVIPTGSMSPSLQGQHKDVECTECGYSFRTTASSEGEERDKLMARLRIARGMEAERIKAQIASLEVVGGMCPMCRYLMPMRPDLPEAAKEEVGATDIEDQPSYPGDRILVNKYVFDFGEPARWDVVVFKFPGDGYMNYIKRLVGLPGETLQVYQGDVFIKPLGADNSQFRLERKPPAKVAAMLQTVHDTEYESATLYKAGWPLRWAATTRDGWNVEAEAGEQTVKQRFTVDQKADSPEAWLRYRHLLPDEAIWAVAQHVTKAGSWDELTRKEGASREEFQSHAIPQLINDFNAYNARLLRSYAERGWRIDPNSGPNSGSLGTEWVGDLAVECEVNVEEPRGELTLDLVEAGNHFRATINLETGKVALSAVDGRTGQPRDIKGAGQTPIKSAGNYELKFANVDDQLLLWVDDDLIDCGDATYDPDESLGGREGLVPWASANMAEDQGDLAPVGVAARGAKLEVTRLAVLRDIYYIATEYPGDMQHTIDYDPPRVSLEDLFRQPSEWQHFDTRRKVSFDIKEGQLFVMGDNSPESKDCRLWMMRDAREGGGGVPGGQYLDRRLLIGKAICVFWPHSWGSIPGLPMLPGFPNFGDMRLVR
jgi:signal peptidase I